MPVAVTAGTQASMCLESCLEELRLGKETDLTNQWAGVGQAESEGERGAGKERHCCCPILGRGAPEDKEKLGKGTKLWGGRKVPSLFGKAKSIEMAKCS